MPATDLDPRRASPEARLTASNRSRRTLGWWLLAAAVLAVTSVFVGVGAVDPAGLLRGDHGQLTILWTSRVPRTLAVILSGAAMGVTGLVMQALTRNRFVAPATAGTLESATLGLLIATVVAPASSIGVKMAIAAVGSLLGTGLFLWLIERIRFADLVMVPLVGIMLGGVIMAITTFVAYRWDLLQTLVSWTNADFSATIRGRYELLWLVAVICGVVWAYGQRFTIASLGREVSVNLGIDHTRTVLLGLALVAVITAVVVVVIGVIPFLGLVVPNLVTMRHGDRLERVIPLTAIGGATFLLATDLVSRTIRHPFEMPVGTVAGVVGGAIFLTMLLRGRDA